MAIAVVGMLDEREEGLQLLKSRIESRGHKTILIDISIGTGVNESSMKPDITGDELVRNSGLDIHRIKEMLAAERDKATSIMAESLSTKVKALYRDGHWMG